MNKYLQVLLSSSLLISCAAQTTKPIMISENVYLVSSMDREAFPTGGLPLLEEALKEANLYCSERNKVIHTLEMKEGKSGVRAKATVKFTCLNNN